MQCRLIDDKEQWNKFVAGQSHAQFLQSWEWGEFQKAFGRRVWRILCHSEPSEAFQKGRASPERSEGSGEESSGAAQIFEHYLGLGMGYLYCPRGPVFSLSFQAKRGILNNNESEIKELLKFIIKNIVNYGHVFFRFEPSHSERTIQELSLRGAPPAGGATKQSLTQTRDCFTPACPAGRSFAMTFCRIPSIQPTHTLLLDLNKSEEQLLAAMHQKTRYNVRLAEKKGLEFVRVILTPPAAGEESFKQFWRLMRETVRRDKIKLHSKKYYQLMLKITESHLLIANYHNKMLAGGIFMGFGDTFTYVHGASANEHRDLMAPYFLHWRAIQFAKQNGYQYYDFGGVNPDNANDFDFKASWAGITRFKRGFGGEVFSFVGAYEMPFQPRIYKLFQQVKKCLHRSMDRTQDSGSCNRGSTPLGGKN